jgi:hypothetical protein
LKEKVAAPVYKTENTAVVIRHADHATLLYVQKLAITSPKSGSRTKATQLCYYLTANRLAPGGSGGV